jgi:glutaminyl-peptide cyclotransferase
MPLIGTRAAALVAVLALAVAVAGCSLRDRSDAGSSVPVTLTLAPTVTTGSTDLGASTDLADPTTPTSTPTPTEAPTTPSSAGEGAGSDAVARYRGNLTVEVVAEHPHDPAAFTQGLEFHHGRLVESTGLWGESTLRLVDPHSGDVLAAITLDDTQFGEGVTVVGDLAYQLTWKSQTLLVTDLSMLEADPSNAVTEVRPDAYGGEGWGLCHDGTYLVMSNGTAELAFRNPETFDVARWVTVTLNGSPVSQLNELECIGDRVWANVWHSTSILVIDPDTGVVDATVDASSLVPDGQLGSQEDVLNGIAYDPGPKRLWLTGKRWPVVYEVELRQSPD